MEKFIASHLAAVCVFLVVAGIVGVGLCMKSIAKDMGSAAGTALCYPRKRDESGIKK